MVLSGVNRLRRGRVERVTAEDVTLDVLPGRAALPLPGRIVRVAHPRTHGAPSYLRRVLIADALAIVGASVLAFRMRFGPTDAPQVQSLAMLTVVPTACFSAMFVVVDAEARLRDLSASSEGNAVLFKMKEDPRVTRVGRLLRRTSVDELPQLVNVLLGQMSLVGPRPPLAREVAVYGDDARRKLLVKPGLTGLWQINGRSDLDWDESVRLDLRYVENWSFAFDFMILWKTFGAVLRSRGAY